MGDGSRGDNFNVRSREDCLNSFLDHVEKNNGELIIAGDLFELWQYKLDNVVDRRYKLLDRFEQMGAVYLPGNHDMQVSRENVLMHPFFGNVQKQTVRTINGSKVKFMHGHEVDPFIPQQFNNWSKLLGTISSFIDFHGEICVVHRDIICDIMCEIGENVLKCWNSLFRKVDRTMREYYAMSNDNLARIKKPLRTRKMLERYYKDLTQGLYDMAIVGHTHQPGSHDIWYFNSGSWTGKTNNFLRVSPDCQIEICNWTDKGREKITYLI